MAACQFCGSLPDARESVASGGQEHHARLYPTPVTFNCEIEPQVVNR